MNVKLGDTGSDIVTGFEGVVMGVCTYLTGCDQILLTPRVGEDNAIRKGQWFDETRIVRVAAATRKLLALRPTERAPSDDQREAAGPDMPAPLK